MKERSCSYKNRKRLGLFQPFFHSSWPCGRRSVPCRCLQVKHKKECHGGFSLQDIVVWHFSRAVQSSRDGPGFVFSQTKEIARGTVRYSGFSSPLNPLKNVSLHPDTSKSEQSSSLLPNGDLIGLRQVRHGLCADRKGVTEESIIC